MIVNMKKEESISFLSIEGFESSNLESVKFCSGQFENTLSQSCLLWQSPDKDQTDVNNLQFESVYDKVHIYIEIAHYPSEDK